MKLTDFTEKEQNEINGGLPEAEISDKEAADKIIALVPQEWIKAIPFFVRRHAVTKTIAKIADEHPDLYKAACLPGEIPESEREELRPIIPDIFKEKMNKHKIIA